MNDNDLTLGGDFAQPTFEEWSEAVAKVLNKGRPEDKQLSPANAVKKLVTTTVDGLTIEPMYLMPEKVEDLGLPGAAPFTRGTTVRRGEMDAWDVRALHEDGDAERTRKAINEDLERGVTSLWLRVDPDAIKPKDVQTVLADVLLDLAKIDVTSLSDQAAAANALLAVFESSGKANEELSLNLGIDPVGHAAITGQEANLDDLAEWVKKVASYHRSRAIMVDGTLWHNAGAGDIHEAAWILATAAEYVRALVVQGVSVDDAFKAIAFRVSATTDQFATIARLRALRTVWNRIGEAYGVAEENRGARQHAVQSWRQLTRDDAHVNILRSTISTFGAAVGGAEAITVLPFDSIHGLPKAFGRRIARNTQIVLAEESNIGRVNDPAGGSWYVEALTSQLEQAIWAEIQRVEAKGGMTKALADGTLKETLDSLNAERAKRLASRKQPITGVSEFPRVDELTLDVYDRPAAPERQGFAWHRDAEVFEALRDRTAELTSDTEQPSVFLACLGTRRDFGPREGFASNLFHIAGLPTPSCEGGTVDQVVEAWKAAQTPVACLCSSPKVYAEQGAEVAKALREAGCSRLYLAGNFAELGDDSAKELFDGNIALGCDVTAVLTATLDTLAHKGDK